MPFCFVPDSGVSRKSAAEATVDVTADVVSVRVSRVPSLSEDQERYADLIVEPRLAGIQLQRLLEKVQRSVKIASIESPLASKELLFRHHDRIGRISPWWQRRC